MLVRLLKNFDKYTVYVLDVAQALGCFQEEFR